MALAMVILHTYAYPALLIFIIVARITDKAWKRYQQQQRLATSARWSRLVPYVCLGCVHAMGAKRLVPGDVIVIQPGVAMCDAVLLRGGALCEQSTLTGEVRHNADYDCLLACTCVGVSDCACPRVAQLCMPKVAQLCMPQK